MSTAGLRQVARGGALNLFGAAIGAGVNLGLVVVVTRGFSPEQAGVFFSATAVFVIVIALANLGTSNGLVYFIARVRTQGAAHLVPQVLRLALGPVVALAVLLGLVLAGSAPRLAALLGEPEAGAYLQVLGVFLPFAVFTDAVLAATRGVQEMRPTVVVEKIARPLAQLALLGGAAGTGAAGFLVVAWAGPYLPAALVAWGWMWWVLRRDSSSQPPPDQRAGDSSAGVEPRVDARAFWGFALPRSVANLAQIGIQRSGIVLVAVLRGAADAAVFTAVTRFVVAGQFATQAVQLAVQPRLTELLTTGDIRATNVLYQSSTAWLVALTWPMYLPTIVFAPVLLSLFGAHYPGGSSALLVVALGMMAVAACGMSDLALTMTGRTGWNLANNLAALVVNVLLCLALIPPLGAFGAAVAWVVGALLRCLLALVQLAYWLGLRPWGRGVGVAMAASCGWLGLVPLCGLLLGGQQWPAVVGSVTVGGLGYVATLWHSRAQLGLDGLVRRRAAGRELATP